MRRWKSISPPCFVALLALAHAAWAFVGSSGPPEQIDLGVVSIPEPSTLLLFAVELSGLAARRREQTSRVDP